MADGTMPQLAKLVARGQCSVLLSQHPPLSPLVWTTMMTGVSPLEHRILDFTRFNPVTHAQEPITSDERAVPAIWNMAASAGKRVDVIGMWATYPPETINGTIVSDRDVSSGERDPWKRTLIDTETVHRRALEVIRKDKPDLAIVYFEGTDGVGHLMPDPNNQSVRTYFRSIDRMLGDYAAMKADLMIASDHGFRWFDHPPVSSSAPGTAAKWHRNEGIYLFVGPHGSVPANTMQVCSTILKKLGLPADVSQYRRRFHRQQTTTDARGSSEEIAKLRSLGYITGSESGSATSTRTAGSWDNEGLILRQQGKLDEAEKAFEQALTVDPKSSSAMWNLADLAIHRAESSKDAIALLTRAMERSDVPELRLYRGRYELQAKDCRSALADFRRYAREDAMKYASIGTAEMCLGNRNGAIAAFRKSLALDPNQPPVRDFLEQAR